VSFEKLLLFDDQILASTANDAKAYVDFLSGNFDDGVDVMEEAIRLAMTAGSKWRGAYYIYELANNYCELGQKDEMRALLSKWQDNLSRIPMQLCYLRLAICMEEIGAPKKMLDEMKDDLSWRRGMRLLGIDYDELLGLIYIKENKYGPAMDTLGKSLDGKRPAHSSYYFLGFAAFENGDAEQASSYFKKALEQRMNMVFPYHRDPIRYVQSLFYLGETNLATGKSKEAAKYYEKFLSYWGNAGWNLEAVARARDNLKTLVPPAG
jgi:tetratricopeptide (TPR) repeat protein